MVIKKSVSFLVMLVLVFFAIGIVSATVRYVESGETDTGKDCSDVNDGCGTIQKAIDQAASGDQILVRSGAYDEDLYINKSLNLTSNQGADAIFINGSIHINASDIIIGGSSDRGFQIRNSTAPDGDAYLIKIGGDSATNLTNIEISYNVLNMTNMSALNQTNKPGTNVTSYVAQTEAILIQVKNISGLIIHKNDFYFFNVSNFGIASYDLGNITNITITNNTFNSNLASNYTAILLTTINVSTTPSLILGNRFEYAFRGIVIGNTTTGAGPLFGSSYLRIDNNTFFKNNVSIDIVGSAISTENKTQDIRITNNNFTWSWTSAIAINASTTVDPLGNSIRNQVDQLHVSNYTVSGNIFEVTGNTGKFVINNSFTGRTATRERTIIAENNYWGAATGPGGGHGLGGNGAGAGGNVTLYVDFSPWYTNISLISAASNNTIVERSGNYFLRIQDAINNASYGDIIEVVNGTYLGNITINQVITLRSIDSLYGNSATIINGSIAFLGGANGSVIGGTANRGFTIQFNGNEAVTIKSLMNISGVGKDIVISYNIFNITNVTYGGKRSGAMGITIETANINNITIHQNVFYINDTGRGIVVDDAGMINVSSLSITNNSFYASSIYNYTSAIHITSLNVSTYESNILGNRIENANRGIILGNWTLGVGIYFNNSWLRIDNNTFYRNNVSIDIISTKPSSQNYTQNITITYNNFTGSYNYAIAINVTDINDSQNNLINNISSYLDPRNFTITNNRFTGNKFAIKNQVALTNLTAKYNFWGNTTHGSPGNQGGNGDNITSVSNLYVSYSPWWKYSNLTIHEPSNASTTTTTTTTTSSSSGGSVAATITWTMTYVATEDEVSSATGYNKELGTKQRVKLKIDDVYHYVGVTGLTASTATLEISSDPQTATLNVGDIRKFDVTDDGYYDVSVKLNSIASNKADVTINKIYEEITEEKEAEQAEQEAAAQEKKEQETEKEVQKRTWTWVIIIVIVIILIAIAIGIGIKKKRR